MTELQKVVYEVLKSTEGAMHVKDIFAAVKHKAPHLCDDTNSPCPYCKQKHPLWQHQTRWALTYLKEKKLAQSAGKGMWAAIEVIPSVTPGIRRVPVIEAPPPDVSLHESIKVKLKQIGEVVGRYCQLEFRDPPYVYDVVWSDIEGLPPSHVFEVQDKGQVNGALSKLQHALGKFPCQGRLFVVVTGEKDRRKIDALLHPFLTGTFHKLSKHVIILNPEEVDEMHKWMTNRQTILRRLLAE